MIQPRCDGPSRRMISWLQSNAIVSELSMFKPTPNAVDRNFQIGTLGASLLKRYDILVPVPSLLSITDHATIRHLFNHTHCPRRLAYRNAVPSLLGIISVTVACIFVLLENLSSPCRCQAIVPAVFGQIVGVWSVQARNAQTIWPQPLCELREQCPGGVSEPSI